MSKRFEHALVVGKFAPPHRGHQYLLDTATAEANRLTILVWANPDFPAMPSERRAGWLRELYPDADIHVPENPPDDAAPDGVHRHYVKDWLEKNGISPDVVLTSENYGEGFAAVLGIPHRLVDLGRVRIPTSGTAVRADVHANLEWLDPRIYRHFVERVVVMGAESTGKTTLTARLAQEFQTVFVHEYGRTHYEERGGILELEDYVIIARRHRELEDEGALTANRFLFSDTNAITTLSFCYAYHHAAPAALHPLADDCRNRYRHVFLCADDIPFEQDGWRDNELLRSRMQGMIIYDLERRGIPFTTIRGSLDERVETVRRVLTGEALPGELPRTIPQLGPRPDTR